MRPVTGPLDDVPPDGAPPDGAPDDGPNGPLRWALPIAVAVSVAAIALAWVHPPMGVGPGGRSQLVGLLRVGLTSVTAATLLLGPGLVLRARWRRAAQLPLGFVPVPGLLVLAALGGLVWVTAGHLDVHLTSRIAVLAILVAIFGWSRSSPVVLVEGEARVLGVAAVVFVIALGKSLWSLGPVGELYQGTISRTLEVGDRSDSRISYHVTTLVAHGLAPYSKSAAALFSPYTFSDRGPLPGILTAPVMLASGTMPSPSVPNQPWSIFDPQGFMVYRIVMMMLALTALLAVYTVSLRVAGSGVAWLAVLTVAGTPFFVHDVYFTWPKFVAAAQCLLAAYLILQRKPFIAGLFVGLGLLMHPVALLSVPALLLLVVLVTWPTATARERLRAATVAALALLAGLAVVAVAWRLVNGRHYSQSAFINYFRDANNVPATSLGTWVHTRWISLLNTFVPLRLPLRDSNSRSINSVYARSDGVVHFFFQYWTGLAFGASIIFYPVLLWGLYRMVRTRPAVTICLGVVPLVVFAVYWGSYTSGLLREGLHTWVLTILILWAMQFAPRFAQGASLPIWLRVVLVLRVVDVLVMMTVPTLDATHKLYAQAFRVGDAAAVVLMLGGTVALAVIEAIGLSRVGGPASRITELGYGEPNLSLGRVP